MVTYLTGLSEYFKKQQGGHIVVVSSVAGDRSRKSNYIYGTSKGALTLFCDGLRSRLYKDNINVLIVKPGFVDTPLTAHIVEKGFLWSNPKSIAKDISKSIYNKKSRLYTPWYWFLIMLIIKMLPEKLFFKFEKL